VFATRVVSVVLGCCTAVVGFAAVSCGGDDDSTGLEPEPVVTVTVTPPAATIRPGGMVQLQASVMDAAGASLGGEVTWSSSNENVATVSENGLVSGISDGTASISAASEGKSGSAAITVRTAVASIEVLPEGAQIAPSETLEFQAITRDSDGNMVTARQIVWSSGDDDVATVSQTGLVTGVADGTTSITATTEGEKGSARLTVVSAEPTAAKEKAKPWVQ
jgi:uncharacterized protein YjdB